MNSLNKFKHLIQKIEYSGIKSNTDEVLGWNAYIYDHRGVVEAGGTAKTKETALRIAYAELIERTTFLKFCSDSDKKTQFQIDKVPTTCGFAAGFSKSETKHRSVCEAIERWCWSQWIDQSRKIDIFVPTQIDAFTKFFIDQFDEHCFFIKKINTEKISEVCATDLYFCAFLGFKANGVFLGSRVSNNFSDLYQHSSIEAYRAKIIFDNLKNTTRKNDFYIDRVRYWGNHRENIPDFQAFNNIEFDFPKLSLSREVTESEEYYIHRSLCENYIPWHLGDEKRFIY